MTAPRTHYAVEVLYDTLFQPLCQQNRDAFADIGRDIAMTTSDEDVTCRRCLKAMGCELPVAKVEPVPMRRAA